MLELTPTECDVLEKQVIEKLCSGLPESNDGSERLYSTIAKIAVEATITTIREYERMKDQ